MVPLILEPLLLRGNDDFVVVITFQNEVFHNDRGYLVQVLYVVITFQNKVFHNSMTRKIE